MQWSDKEKQEQEEMGSSFSDDGSFSSKVNLDDCIFPTGKARPKKEVKDNLNGLFFRAPSEPLHKIIHKEGADNVTTK